MINLRGAILGGKGYVFDQVVARLVEKKTSREINQELPKLTFEPGGFDDAGNDEDGYQVPKHRNQRLEHGVKVHLTGVLVVLL
ncbi:MAG: hypothetical protein MH213_11180 [Marinobacter sp.]|nr:hypothetical protein [Marinobacter sp.]